MIGTPSDDGVMYNPSNDMSDEKQVHHYLNEETGLIEEVEIVLEPHIASRNKDTIFVLVGLKPYHSPMESQSYYWTRKLEFGDSPPMIAYLPKFIEEALVRPLEYDDSAWVTFDGKKWVITRIESYLIKHENIPPMDYSGSHRK